MTDINEIEKVNLLLAMTCEFLSDFALMSLRSADDILFNGFFIDCNLTSWR